MMVGLRLTAPRDVLEGTWPAEKHVEETAEDWSWTFHCQSVGHSSLLYMTALTFFLSSAIYFSNLFLFHGFPLLYLISVSHILYVFYSIFFSFFFIYFIY